MAEVSELQLGTAYRGARGIVLALDTDLILICENRVLSTRRIEPYEKFAPREISIRDLAMRWRVSSKAIEAATEGYFSPDETGRDKEVEDYDPDTPDRLTSADWRHIRSRPLSIRRGRVLIDK